MFEIIDNFLDKDYNEFLQGLMTTNSGFEWRYAPTSCEYGSLESPIEGFESVGDFQFNHVFLNDRVWRDQHLVEPLLNKLNPKALVRVKANMITQRENPKVSGWHRDPIEHSEFDGEPMIALYFVNDNDGYCLLEDGTKILAKANRLVKFSGDIMHTAVGQSNTKVRTVININYFN